MERVIPASERFPDLSAWAALGETDFLVRLHDGTTFNAHEVLRCLPGRRLVCRGVWKGREVVAKLFVGDGADRYAQRDARGSRAMAKAGVSTPALLHVTAISGQAGWALIYTFIHDARTAESVWQKANPQQHLELASELVQVVAKLHAAGLVQTDLYLRNFLYEGDSIHALDGDGIRIHSRPLSWRRALPNLALLLSKFDVENDAHLDALLDCYASERGWRPTPAMRQGLRDKVNQLRSRLARDYAWKKVLRNCSDVLVRHSFRRFVAIFRPRQSDALSAILENPDAWLDAPSCRRLKNGNTCTVGLLEQGGKIVIKRYNIKSFRHGLNRALRQTRASISWSNAHLLRMLGIPTAQPLALLEQRWGWLRGRSYFLAEYVEGPDIAEVLADAGLSVEDKQEIALGVARLLHRLYLLGIAHGDLKASNLKIVDGKPVLLDLDGLRMHRCGWWFRRRHVRDLRRFLRNWQHDATTLQLLQAAIRSAYGAAPILKTNEIWTE